MYLVFIHFDFQNVDSGPFSTAIDTSNGTASKISEVISRVSSQKGPTRHAYAWQIGPFWQDTLGMWTYAPEAGIKGKDK